VSRGGEVHVEIMFERQGVVWGKTAGLMGDMQDEKMYEMCFGTLWIRRGVTLNLNSSWSLCCDDGVKHLMVTQPYFVVRRILAKKGDISRIALEEIASIIWSA
jgi:hypothetical protein